MKIYFKGKGRSEDQKKSTENCFRCYRVPQQVNGKRIVKKSRQAETHRIRIIRKEFN